MAKYFNYFPKTFYTNDNNKNGVDVVTNIIARFSFNSALKENSSAFYQYDIKDTDTPEIIAYKYYGNVERHWIVLLFNNIIDPQFDWPMQDRVFNEYVNSKYGSRAVEDGFSSGLSWARSQSNVHSYYKVTRTVLSSDKTSYTDELQIDEQTYNELSDTTETYVLPNGSTITETVTKKIKTFYDFELGENESKRKINLLKPEFVPEVEKEFKRVVKL
jgi:hypothetical protein